MKLTESESEYLSRIIRSDFDNIDSRYRSNLHRYEAGLEAVEITKGLAKKFDCDALDELAEEMRNDLEVEHPNDPNEDRDNDSDYNNEKESNFRNVFK